MKFRFLALALGLVTSVAVVSGETDARARDLFEAARKSEVVDGDLGAAIRQYEAVVSSSGGDRAIAAQALVRMAECYRRLGDAQAKEVYERILRDFADQEEAVAVARAHLGSPGGEEAPRGDRAVWSGPEVDGFGTVSPDGRLLTYVDWNTGRLMLRDLARGEDHALTTGGWADGQAQFSAISRDGQRIAYEYGLGETWTPEERERFYYRLYVGRLQGHSLTDSRVLLDNEDITSASPYDWSPDGRWLAVRLTRRDQTSQIALVDTRDGAIRPLKTTDWRGPTKVFFSPDGRFLAYDLSADETTARRDVLVMAIDGSREVAAVADPADDVMMGWSPDGTRLLFASDRSGSVGLWALPTADGRPTGPPELVKSDIGSAWSLGLTPSGALYVWKETGATYLQLTTLDGGVEASPRPAGERHFGRPGGPDWSRDGGFVAFASSCGGLGGPPCHIVVLSADTGEARELWPRLAYFNRVRWSPDGRSLIVGARDLKGRNGLFRIDADTGEATSLTGTRPFGGQSHDMQLAPDGRRLYYRVNDAAVLVVRALDLDTGAESEALRVPSANPTDLALSPDGRTFAWLSQEVSGDEMAPSTVVVVDASGGTPRSLFTGPLYKNWVPGMLQWTPDGSGLVVTKKPEGTGSAKELWLVPLDGPARRIEIDASDWMVEGGFCLSPDGRRVAFVGEAGRRGTEIWALENILPEAAPDRSARR